MRLPFWRTEILWGGNNIYMYNGTDTYQQWFSSYVNSNNYHYIHSWNATNYSSNKMSKVRCKLIDCSILKGEPTLHYSRSAHDKRTSATFWDKSWCHFVFLNVFHYGYCMQVPHHFDFLICSVGPFKYLGYLSLTKSIVNRGWSIWISPYFEAYR